MIRFNVFGAIVDVEAEKNYTFLTQLDVEYGSFKDSDGENMPDCTFRVYDKGMEVGQGIRTVCGNRLVICGQQIDFCGDVLEHNHFYIDDFRPYFTTMIYMILHMKRKFIMFHSACFTYDNEACLIMGESGAGKSSIALMNLLNGADYFSNDITYLACADQVVSAYGLPQIMNLGDAALEWFQCYKPEAFAEICAFERKMVFSNKTKACVRIHNKKIKKLEAKLKAVVFVEQDFNSAQPWFEHIDVSCGARKMLEGIRPMDKVGFHPAFPLEVFFRDLYHLIASMDKQVKFFNFYWTKDHNNNINEFVNMVGTKEGGDKFETVNLEPLPK